MHQIEHLIVRTIFQDEDEPTLETVFLSDDPSGEFTYIGTATTWTDANFPAAEYTIEVTQDSQANSVSYALTFTKTVNGKPAGDLPALVGASRIGTIRDRW